MGNPNEPDDPNDNPGAPGQDDGIPLRLKRKLAHECLWCGEPAAPNDDYCERHAEIRRIQRATSAQRTRAVRRKKRRCVDCGKRSSKYRCARCRAESVHVKPGVGDQKSGVGKEQIWRVDPGTNWSRFRGKGRRGRLTREQQADEDKRDAKFAIIEIGKFIAAVDRVLAVTLQDLPQIQRDEEKRKAAQYLGTAGRFLDALAERYGG